MLKVKVNELENSNKQLVQDANEKMEKEKNNIKIKANLKEDIEELEKNISFFEKQQKSKTVNNTPSLLGDVNRNLFSEKNQLEEKLCEFENMSTTEVKLYR